MIEGKVPVDKHEHILYQLDLEYNVINTFKNLKEASKKLVIVFLELIMLFTALLNKLMDIYSDLNLNILLRKNDMIILLVH